MRTTRPQTRDPHTERPAQTTTDDELVARIRTGEPELFELVMRRYNRLLFRVARSILGDDGEAEEAVQEAYVRAYQRICEFRGPRGFRSWLCRIAANEALMRKRRMVNRAPHAPVEEIDDAAQREVVMANGGFDSTDPEVSTHRAQLRGLLEQAIDSLPEPYRLAYVLREVEQMSVREAAATLDIDTTTVKTRLHRARRLLRRALHSRLADTATEVFPFAGWRCDRIVVQVMSRLSDPVPPDGPHRLDPD